MTVFCLVPSEEVSRYIRININNDISITETIELFVSRLIVLFFFAEAETFIVSNRKAWISLLQLGLLYTALTTLLLNTCVRVRPHLQVNLAYINAS